MEYTQANKKREVAQKMGLKMNGPGSSYGGGMKYSGNGKNSTQGGGMKPKLHGTGGVGKLAQKPIMSEKHTPVGNSIYKQHGGY